MNLIANIEKGKITYDKDKMQKIISMLFDGTYLVSFTLINPQSDKSTYRRLYFLKVDTICKEQGDTRASMHENIKSDILANMMEETPELFEEDCVALSTECLSLEGWRVFVEKVDMWAFVNFNIFM